MRNHPEIREFPVLSSFLVLFLALGGGAAEAQKIQVDSADPPFGEQGQTLDVRIKGRGFAEGAVARFLLPGTSDPERVTVNRTTFMSRTEVIANITIAEDALIDLRDIEVQTNGRTGKGIELFSVTAPGGGAGLLEDTPVIVILRDAQEDGLLSDGAPYVDGEGSSNQVPVEAVFFGSSNPGNLRLRFEGGKGKNHFDADRELTLDLSQQKKPGEGYPPDVTGNVHWRYLFAAADQGNEVNLKDENGDQIGIQQVTKAMVEQFKTPPGVDVDFDRDGVSDGSFVFEGVPARLSLYFLDPDNSKLEWSLRWAGRSLQAMLDDEILGFGVITCVQSQADRDMLVMPAGEDDTPCLAWTIRPGRVWVDENDDGMIRPTEIKDGANGFAELVSMNKKISPDAGIFSVPTEILVCLKDAFTGDDCAALLLQSPQ